MIPREVLDEIDRRLADTPPLEVIESMMPLFIADAVTWVRRLPHWEEYRGECSGQAVSLACVVSRRTMREFGITLIEDGRVVERDKTPRTGTASIYRLVVAGQRVQVRYLPSLFPVHARDEIAFDAECNPLSETGHWHQFVHHDAVEAFGGPKAFAAALAEARATGRDTEFMGQLEGRFPDSNHRPPAPAKANESDALAVGKHTAAEIEKRMQKNQAPVDSDRRVQQEELF